MNANYRNLTEDEIYDILRLAPIKSQKDLSIMFKTSHQTISKLMKKHNVKGLYYYRGLRYEVKKKVVKVDKGEMFNIDKYKGNIIFLKNKLW